MKHDDIARVLSEAADKIAKIVQSRTLVRVQAAIGGMSAAGGAAAGPKARKAGKTKAAKPSAAPAGKAAKAKGSRAGKKRCPHPGCNKIGKGPRFGFYCELHRGAHGYAPKAPAAAAAASG